jgi:hypothetical protein
MTAPRTLLAPLSLACALSLLAACGNDETSTLFDEAGAWSVVRYDLEGAGDLPEVSPDRRDKFMLSFDKGASVVTSAACASSVDGRDTPADTPCIATPGESEWVCQCFGYAFENDRMKWREFEAGSAPPTVSFDDGGGDGGGPPAGDDAATGDGGSGTGGADDGGADDAGGPPPGSDFTVQVAETEQSATFAFIGIPTGTFGSNGTTSRFIMQARAPSLFNQAFEDAERPTCEPCI